MSDLVIVQGNELYVGTWKLSKGFGVEHRQLKRYIELFKSEFEEFGIIAPMRINNDPKKGEKRGRKIEEYIINEEQATYLTTLMKNTEQVRKFKRFLTKEFFRQRKLLTKLIIQKENAEWLEKRAEGKIERRLETDTIQAFVQYAKNQGSKNAEKYYMIITKMENAALFINYLKLEFPNLRDVVNGFALDSLKMADRIAAKAIKEGMLALMPYKEIYQLAKERVETFSMVLGKTPLQMVLSKEMIRTDAKSLN